MKKVLWLTSWYPNVTEPFSGDFIKRQAEAVALYQPIKTLYVGKYLIGKLSHESIITNELVNLEENILYVRDENNLVAKIKFQFAYFKMYLKFIKHLQISSDLPNLVHVHVAMKAGLIALYLKWKYKIPYVLTEHWSGYYAISKDSLYKKSYLTRYLTRLIIKNADRFLPVSEDLGMEISRHLIPVSFQKIPNVVNTSLFYPSDNRQPDVFRFIHVSSLLYPKNPEGIIRAFTELLTQGFKAELVLVGPLNHSINQFIYSAELSRNQIHCTGEISYKQVGIELRNSSALVMFSYYETMSCVVIEALCTGLPVISSRVGGIPEVIHENNGILIRAGDEKELLQSMKEMIYNRHLYDKDKISRQAAEQYSYETIGKKIIDVYDSVLGNK